MENLPYQLGPYLLIHEIGHGGFSNVYLALKKNRPFLVKCLRTDRAAEEKTLRQFLQEVRIASHISHPNIVSFVDSGKVEDIYFGVMELHLGAGLNVFLADYMRPNGNAPLPFSLYVIHRMIEALHYLHGTTVYEHSDSVLFHGDVSPENVLIMDDGQVKLMDFGSAGQESFSDKIDIHYGKLAYLPFEVTRHQAVDHATDVYSMAVVTFMLLFGRKPFDGPTKKELMKSIRDDDVPRVDCGLLVETKRDEAALRIFFNQALHKDPQLRFPDIGSFADAFHAIRFREQPAQSPEEFKALFGSSFMQTLRNLRVLWTNELDRFRQSAKLGRLFLKNVADVKVENILAQQEIRRYPRIKVENQKVTAEVIAARTRWKSTFPVFELGLGGLMLEWKALASQSGQQYPILLHLGNKREPIKTLGEVRYEISRGSDLFVGLKFAKISTQATDQIERFLHVMVKGEPQALRGHAPMPSMEPGATVLEVFFKTPAEWKREFSENVRQGGIFIRTTKPYQNDEAVVIRIHLPHHSREFVLQGKVVFCKPMEDAANPRKHGVGVELQLTEELMQDLSQTT